jgi:hypothetical protein
MFGAVFIVIFGVWWFISSLLQDRKPDKHQVFVPEGQRSTYKDE